MTTVEVDPATEVDPAIEAKETAEGLRALADVIEQYGGVNWPLPNVHLDVDVAVGEFMRREDGEWGTVYDHEATMKALRKAARGLGPGKKEKSFSDFYFMVEKTFSSRVSLRVKASRQAVCKKVPTGRTIVHAASTQHYPERIEEEFEWVCEDSSVLKGASSV